MCGIVGYVGKKNALHVIISGLERLEYRGYDSAGFAINVKENDGQVNFLIKKSVGKLEKLKDEIRDLNVFATNGMGHTRWATHGAPNLNNAHPHKYGKVSLIHNGILENHRIIKEKLKAQGHEFYSDTDTEVAAHLLDDLIKKVSDPILALSMLCDTIAGTYAFGIMFEHIKEKIFFVKKGSPLIVAKGKDETFFASDQTALVDHDPMFYSLKDHEIGCLSFNEVRVFDLKGEKKDITWSKLVAKKEQVEKMGFEHFMKKEIFEQPEVIDRVLLGRLVDDRIDFLGFDIDFDLIKRAQKIHIVACGSAYYAGLLARSDLESLLRIPVSVEIASEYRYRNTLADQNTLVIAISQSGETADTLAAIEKAFSVNAMCMSVCNVLGSAIANACEKSVGNIFLNAGAEVSVASTKTFVAQNVALKLFVLAIKKKFFNLDKEQLISLQFKKLKESIKNILQRDEEITAIAKGLINEPRMLFLGRGDFYPVALEGALKMKELSYIFAEGYPAGELKHGPIATIDYGMPALVIFGSDQLQIKTQSNLQEIKARGAKIISIAPKNSEGIKEESEKVFFFDDVDPMFEPIVATIPLQLLAYHLSVLKGIDVDKPRNLAKSVTVE